MPTSERHDATDTRARRLAVGMNEVRLSDIPPDVRQSATLRVLDMVGIIASSLDEPGPHALRTEIEALGGTPEARLVGTATRLPAPSAALVNGTFGHARDFDDTHHASRIHASTVVVPAALAAAQRANASGAELLRAVVVGLETAVRVGMAAPGRFHERGLHATALCGVFGAAAAAGAVLGLDDEQSVRAFGIAGSTASGLREAYLGEPTDTKAFHAGWAAQAGLTAAALAHRGFTGPSTVFEGRFGYYHAFASPDPVDLDALTDGLGETWHTPDIVFKLYPCGSLIHASIDAAIAIHDEHRPDPDAIAEMICIAPPGMVSTVLEPVADKLDPKSGYHAKFSTQYAVVAALLDGTVTEATYDDARRNDPALRSLLQRTRYETDESMPWPHKYPGGVRVVMHDGRTHEVRVANSPGSPDRPATTEDVARKARGNLANAPHGDRCIDLALDLEHLEDLNTLLDAAIVTSS